MVLSKHTVMQPLTVWHDSVWVLSFIHSFTVLIAGEYQSNYRSRYSNKPFWVKNAHEYVDFKKEKSQKIQIWRTVLMLSTYYGSMLPCTVAQCDILTVHVKYSAFHRVQQELFQKVLRNQIMPITQKVSFKMFLVFPPHTVYMLLSSGDIGSLLCGESIH